MRPPGSRPDSAACRASGRRDRASLSRFGMRPDHRTYRARRRCGWRIATRAREKSAPPSFASVFSYVGPQIVVGPGTAARIRRSRIRRGGSHLGQAETVPARACDAPDRRSRRRGRSAQGSETRVLGSPSRKGLVSGTGIGLGHRMVTPLIASNRTGPRKGRHYGDVNRPAATSNSQFHQQQTNQGISDRSVPAQGQQRSLRSPKRRKAGKGSGAAITIASRPPSRWSRHDACQSPSARWMIDRVRPQPGHRMPRHRPRHARLRQAEIVADPRTATRPSETSCSKKASKPDSAEISEHFAGGSSARRSGASAGASSSGLRTGSSVYQSGIRNTVLQRRHRTCFPASSGFNFNDAPHCGQANSRPTGGGTGGGEVTGRVGHSAGREVGCPPWAGLACMGGESVPTGGGFGRVVATPALETVASSGIMLTGSSGSSSRCWSTHRAASPFKGLLVL